MWRSPRLLLMALALVLGLALTAGLIAFDSLARESLEREALLQQGIRVDQLSDQLRTGLATSEQVARSVARLAAPLSERSDVEALVRGALSSTSSDAVYGVGVWFAPFAFDPRQRWVGPYAHRVLDEGGHPGEHIVVTDEWSTPAYDYFRQPWYSQGLQATEAPTFTEPYFDVDFVYSSLLMAMPEVNGKPRGMVSVDIILPQLRSLVARANTSPHEIFYVVTRQGRLFAHPWEEQLIAWARANGRGRVLSDLSHDDLRAYEREHGLESGRRTQTATVRDAGWTVYVSTDEDRLFAAARRVHATAQGVGVVLWLALVAAVAAGLRALRVRELSFALARQIQARRTLERSERTLRDVLEKAMDGVVAVDADGRLVEWNSSAEKLCGWRRWEALGRPAVETLFRPEDRAERAAQFASLIAPGRPVMPCRRLETLALRRDGEVFSAEASLATVQSDGSLRVYAFFSDVTGRRQAEAERQRMLEQQRDLLSQLRQRSSELRAIIENMVEGVFVATAEGRVSFANQAGLRMLGVSALEGETLSAELLSACGIRTMDGAPLPLEALPLSRALHGEVVVGVDLIAGVGPDGDRVVRSNAVPLRNEEGRVVAAVVVSHDITEAVEFDRLKDEFVRMAAHELKTPVAVMKSFAQLALKTDLGHTRAQRRLLEGIDRGANRIDQVVRTLVDVSQLHLGRMRLVEEPLDLRDVVRETARRLGEAHPGHPLQVHAEEAVPMWGDRTRLEQVLAALLDNALRYSPASSAPVDVVLASRGDTVEVSIRDRGIGIPADKQARLFHRFYRPHAGTEHDQGGMGVGLYIAREIIQRHGGQLLLESQEGAGTTVRVVLPLRPARAEEGARPEARERGEEASA